LGSAKPRTPDIVPKYYSVQSLYFLGKDILTCWKDRFSIMSIMTCLTSPRATPLAALAKANRDTMYFDIVGGAVKELKRSFFSVG
jgi:hypothetical protein